MAKQSRTTAMALPDEFHATALAFPDKVRAAIAKNVPLEDSIKALRGGDGLLQLAKDLRATKDDVNAIQRGRFYLIDHIGELLPAGKVGAGRGNKNSKGDLPFSKPTLSAYRKVTAHKDKIDDYFAAKRDSDEPTSVTDFLNFVGSGGVMATRHGNDIIEWYTPQKYIDMAREVMGGIDLDPATSKYAQKIVRAKVYFTADDNGLTREWLGRVFLNPPFKQPLGKQFTAKLCAEVEAGNVKQAVLLTNDQTDTDWWHQVAGIAAAVCFLNGRIGFYNQAGDTSSPTNGQTFCYFGNRIATFAATFGKVGLCMRAY